MRHDNFEPSDERTGRYQVRLEIFEGPPISFFT